MTMMTMARKTNPKRSEEELRSGDWDCGGLGDEVAVRVRVRVKLVVKVGDVNDVASPVVVTEDMLELNDE